MHRTRQLSWVLEAIEKRSALRNEERKDVLYSLVRTAAFENFLTKHFPASKRFGIEGCEALIPGLIAIARRAGELGVTRIEIGMAHRGRLNVLHQLVGKSIGMICAEMDGEQSEVSPPRCANTQPRHGE